ncbi:MAG: LytTR family transcriptional regulator DNA-binding domain-containing protein [Ignavibacterium sp.]|nr:LytTR family transcriptional regulator DNA-binding domain-containing protein [Ignavibacterium sp.]
MKKILLIHGNTEQNFEFQSVLEIEGFNTYITIGESDGLKIADRYMPDIIICDLDNYENELGVVKKLNENISTECIPLLIITSTTNNAHIRAAMELGADDVLVKPIIYKSLLRSINKRLRKIEVLRAHLTDKIISSENAFSSQTKKIDHVLVKIGTNLKLIEFSRIVCISALKEYSKVIIDDGSKVVVRKSIKNWVETLPAKDFLRIHRATIVNMLFLDRIEKAGFRSYNVYLKNLSTPFPISQRYGNIMKKTFSV